MNFKKILAFHKDKGADLTVKKNFRKLSFLLSLYIEM